eukprot:550508-Hanusia_phi.AAC.1
MIRPRGHGPDRAVPVSDPVTGLGPAAACGRASRSLSDGAARESGRGPAALPGPRGRPCHGESPADPPGAPRTGGSDRTARRPSDPTADSDSDVTASDCDRVRRSESPLDRR